jgi:L-alanine-DL-glutamate epimerase-like enolase superfamily enzyme
MKITDIECQILAVPNPDPHSLDTAQDNAVVQVHGAEGITGIGEVESNPWVVKAFIDSVGRHTMDHGFGQLLIGRDLTQPHALWDYLYTKSLLSGRRGAGIHAIGALDMAIWDAYGKLEKTPVWKLLGGAIRQEITPYASLLPRGDTLRSYQTSLMEKVRWSRQAGFRAVKIEVMIKGPHAHHGLNESDEAIVEMVAAARSELGPQIDLMVDVGYCWNDWKEALRVIRRLEKYDIFFVEGPLRPDDLCGLGSLTRSSDIPIASGELLSTRFEFDLLMDKVDVVQPDIGRVGGITEAMRIVEAAASRGKIIVPHCWKSGIGIAATAHVAAASPNCPFIEYTPAEVSESAIRRELVIEELRLEKGRFTLPRLPGLGVQLSPAAMEKFAASGARSLSELPTRN